jgi:hypothetical protein
VRTERLDKVRIEEHQTVWQHPDIPVGFARMQCTTMSSVSFVTKKAKAVEVAEYRIEDAGTGAQSELPDNN